MKRIFLLFVLFFVVQVSLLAQGPRVPGRLEFAGIQLTISPSTRAEIQRDVDALTHSPKYFQIKVDRAVQYFPIIERIFQEEGLPEDFKYLVLQESALIPDAVSSSNAVGFWQFKREAAEEMGMRMDSRVDERMNIVSSTRSAARYIQKNNYYFNNWVLALQAYQMGAGAAMHAVGDKFNGARKMNVDHSTYWYVKKFLAHMIAFRDAIEHNGNNYLKEFTGGSNMTLTQISRRFDVEEQMLMDYNKWLKKGQVPSDKEYTVIIPGDKVDLLARAEPRSEDSQDDFDETEAVRFPEFDRVESPDHPFILEVNGILGIVARESDRIETLADKGNLDIRKFKKYNDIPENHRVREGQVYYLKSKRNKSRIHFHVLQYDETLWEVSQKYGIKLKALIKKNRIGEGEELKPGRVLWLKKKRPKSMEVEYRSVTEPRIPEPAVVNRNNDPSETDRTQTAPTADDPMDDPVSSEDDTTDSTEIGQPADEEDTDPEEIREPDPEPVVMSPPPSNDNADADPAAPETKRIDHKVEKGETLYAIGRKYGVKVSDILKWNDLDINQAIAIGQVLTIYAPVDARISSLEEKFNNEITDEDVVAGRPAANKTSERMEHRVSSGETLYSLSRRYGVSVKQIMDWNNLEAGEPLSIGQVLVFFPGDESSDPVPEKASSGSQDTPDNSRETKYVVKYGETLFAISRKFNVSVDQLIEWNDLDQNGAINEGQILSIFRSEKDTDDTDQAGFITYVVKPGDSLYKISRQYSVTIDDLLDWNDKDNSTIAVGEKILIRE